MGCTPSSVLRNTEPDTSRNHNSHVQGSGSTILGEQKVDSVPTVHLRRPVVQPSRTSSDSSPTAAEVGRTRTHHPSGSARHPGATGAGEDMLLVSSMISAASQAHAAAEAVPSLALFGSKSSESMLPDEVSPPLNNADGMVSEPSSVVVGGVVPLVQVAMDLEMVASVTSHDDSAGGGTSMPLSGAAEAGPSSSGQRRRDRERPSLIRFEQHHQAHNSTSVLVCSDLLAPSLCRGNASCDSSGSSLVGQQQPRRPFLRLTVAHQPSLGGGSVGDIRLSVGGDEPQPLPRRHVDHNGRRRRRSGSSVKATEAETDCMNPLLLDQLDGTPPGVYPHPTSATASVTSNAALEPLQSQQSLFGEGSTSAAWFMDDMSRLAITAKEAASMATEDEEPLVWYDEHEGGAASTAAALGGD